MGNLEVRTWIFFWISAPSLRGPVLHMPEGEGGEEGEGEEGAGGAGRGGGGGETK
jgi:hypothetical protein